MADINVLGLDQVIATLKHLGDRQREALAAALYQEAAAVMAESIKECPVDTGRLRQSNYVAPAEDLDDPAVQVGYGAAYGLYVHERGDLKHPSPTKDHFLSDPLARATDGYGTRVAKRAQGNLNNGVDRKSAGGLYPKRPKT